jgi:hypothetical protein
MKLLAALGAAFAVYLVVMSIAIGSVLGAGGDSASQVLSGSFVVGAHPAGLSSEALRNVEISLRVAEREHAPDLAVTAELVGGLGESHFLVVPNAQGSGYCGVFQADRATSLATTPSPRRRTSCSAARASRQGARSTWPSRNRP